MTASKLLNPHHWDVQYQAGRPIWDSERPCSELRRVLARHRVRPGRAVDLGCGTGTNAIYLSRQGFEPTGIDLSSVAIELARDRAWSAGVFVEFVVGNLLDPGSLNGPFDFFLDRGCYGPVRHADGHAYLDRLAWITRPGTTGLVMIGNANEPEDAVGPPVIKEWQLRSELGRLFEIVDLRPFRFDAPNPGERRYLGWSCFVRRGA